MEYELEFNESVNEEIHEGDLGNVTDGAVLSAAFLTIVAPFAFKTVAKFGKKVCSVCST